VFWTTEAARSGVDIYFGSGGAPEGVLAAAAIRCAGGQMQARLKPENEQEEQRARAMGRDVHAKLTLDDMAPGHVVFAASGVTHGSMFEGVHFEHGARARRHIGVGHFTGRRSRVRSIYPQAN
jgi:fructose-1,6-bisphosphatase/sedoheptulose 1,7-bisphosphatase-like protein